MLTSAGTVAFGIVALLPVELILNVGSGAGFVVAILLRVIITLGSSNSIMSDFAQLPRSSGAIS